MTSLCFSQSDSTFYWFDHTTPEEEILHKIEKNKDKNDFYKLIYYSRLRDTDSIIKYVRKNKSSINDLTSDWVDEIFYFEGYYHKLTSNDSLFLKYNNLAYQNALENRDSITILHSLAALSQTYDYNNNYPYNMEYLMLLKEKAYNYNNNSFKIIHKFLLGNYYLLRDKPIPSSNAYKELLNLDFTKKDSTYILYAYNSLGVLYETTLKNSDSAIYYYKKKLDFMKESKAHSSGKSYFSTFLNLANAYKSKKNYDLAKVYYKKADSLSFKGEVLFNKTVIKENLFQLYEEMGLYKESLMNLKDFVKYNDSLNDKEQRIAIAKIKEEIDNEKLRADNLESEAKRIQNRNLLFGSLGVLLFGGITFLLVQKNTKRKQKLAEQQKEIESQKLATVLKEQELTAIDAMIEGQEKERQRIANDLHDDLGGLMATVKLHFNALKDKNSTELFDKTNQLIDEAYEKVRSVAHAKNSGVIAKQGLLKAVENMAEKISASNKIQIDVIDHGLDNRLENSLELTLFRIIQELITNVIKHAEATEVTIHLTNHDDTINIMVEDNGKGFNPNQVTKVNKGMGISSIDKRVEHLDGKLTIESEKNKGTTVIIDIPL